MMAQTKLFKYFGASLKRSREISEDSDPTDNSDPTCDSSTSEPTVKKKFQAQWLTKYTWLRYDSSEMKMFCEICRKNGGTSALSQGSDNFRTSTLTRHTGIYDGKNVKTEHAEILEKLRLKVGMDAATERAMNKAETGLITCFKTVYWMAKENLAMAKYPSMMKFITDLHCPGTEFEVGKNATYTSRTSALGMLQSIGTVVRRRVIKKLNASPYVALLADETTDISVAKKLIVSARLIDPDTLEPATVFIADKTISVGTGQGIACSMREVMTESGIAPSKVKLIYVTTNI